jgi:hypothetical protein
MYFPLCQLHNTNLVHALPKHCPLAERSPCDALLASKDAGWREEGAKQKAALEAVEICTECVVRLGSHSHVKRLREKKGV